MTLHRLLHGCGIVPLFRLGYYSRAGNTTVEVVEQNLFFALLPPLRSQNMGAAGFLTERKFALSGLKAERNHSLSILRKAGMEHQRGAF